MLFKHLPAGPPENASVTQITGGALAAARKAERRALRLHLEEAAPESTTRALVSDEAANLSEWNSRFEALLDGHGDREQATAALLKEIDGVFSNWVQDQITPLAELPPVERYDRLVIAETSVQEGAAAILKQLGIKGRRHVQVAAGALEAIAAEMQYGEAAPDHASRLAMLRLDAERLERMEQAGAVDDESAKTQAMTDLDVWYETGLAKIFRDEETR
jgi:hypothetical protein